MKPPLPPLLLLVVPLLLPLLLPPPLLPLLLPVPCPPLLLPFPPLLPPLLLPFPSPSESGVLLPHASAIMGAVRNEASARRRNIGMGPLQG